MARPRKTSEMLKLAGTYRADRHADREHEPQPDGHPKIPDWLDETAVAFWQRVVPELVAMRVAHAVDTDALAGMSRWYSAWRQADEKLQTGDGDSYKRSIEATTAWKNFTALAAKFGLTPADRANLSVPPPPLPVDPLNELLQAQSTT